MTAEERIRLFEEISIQEAVRRQVIPAVISQMIALAYNLADTYFVGLLNHPAQTAAVTVSYAPFLMLTAIANLFGVGGAGALSRALGTHDTRTAGKISALSFWMGLLASACYAAVFGLLTGPILRLAGATADTFAAAKGYAVWVIVLGGVPTGLSILLANLLRAEGRAKTASFGVSLGGILNMILDPLLILPRFADLGAVGAGIATAISNSVSMVFFLLVICRKHNDSVIRLAPKHLIQSGHHFHTVLAIGFPSALQYTLTVAAVAAQAKFVSHYPTQAVAALGIAKKLDQLPLYFSIGVSTGLLPLIAYHHASGNLERRRSALRIGLTISFGFSVLCLLFYECFAPQLASLFIREDDTVRYAAAFLRRMVTAMPLMSICYPMIIQFQAMKRAGEALLCSVLRKGVLDIPLLFFMDAVLPLYGLMWVQPIVDAISMVFCICLYQRLKRKHVA